MNSHERGSRPKRLAGSLCLLAGLGASAVLSARHLGAAALPGCGLESACERLLASPWAVLPYTRWPVAFVGASWFLGLAGAWLVARRAWPATFRVLALAGALVSLGLSAAMVVEHTLCPYCLATHAASLAFLVFSERAASGPGDARPPAAAFALLALGSSGALLPFWLARERSARERDERELAGTTRALVSADPIDASAPFTGRYRLGPADAPLRLVVFFDYQCQDCRRIEGEIRALLERRDDLSLSVKHFPLCSDCNRWARTLGANPHREACRAARAAEAAGIAGGEGAFWAMHRWLFERGGSFHDRELAELPELAPARAAYLAAYGGAESLRRVEADVEEALRLGISSTPLIYLNGVELRGWRAPRAVERAVEALAATRPPRATPAGDRPPAALEKCLEDWRAEPAVALAPAGRTRPAGAGGQPPLVLWGDYLDPGTRELDRRVRAFLGAERAALYSFRHFPLDPECDDKVPARQPGACRAARAVEAAFAQGGEPAFGAFHARLMEVMGAPEAAELARIAAELGLDRERFEQDLVGPATLAAVRADIAQARRLGVTSIPCLFAGRRRVPRWRLEGEPLVERILEEALAGR